MYSRRVRFSAIAAGLCLASAMRSGIRVVIKTFDGYGRYSVLGFLEQDQVLLGIGFVGAGIALGAIAMYYARAERRVEQEQRDRIAERLAAKVERQVASLQPGGEIQSFALYLRPFVLEKAIREWKIGAGSFKTFFLETGKVNFEHFLLEIFSSLDVVQVSIGSPDGQEGAGRVITADTEWSDRFRKLADRASTIVVVPGVQPGIIEEIRWLRARGLLGKTAFFKPKWYPRTAWQTMKQLYEDEGGIELPAFSSRQISFRADPAGKCCGVTWWRTGLWRRLTERQMRTLLVNTRESALDT
jgi:hypothetical protein